MSKKTTLKPLAIAVGATFVTALAMTPVANAAENPFALSELSSGYMVAEKMEGKCGEGMSGDKTMKEGKCGEGMSGDKTMKEGKCGMKMMDADGDGKITKDEFTKAHEAMFNRKDKDGDGVIDADEMKAMEGKMMKEGKCGEGKCGGDKTMKEGKCGEGKCGGAK